MSSGDVAERAAAEVLVAVDGGRVIGGVTSVPDGGPMADPAGPGETGLRMLVVARAARGRGAGEALVRTCVERARATRGCGGACCRPGGRRTPPTVSTNVSAPSAPPGATGTRCRTWTTPAFSPAR